MVVRNYSSAAEPTTLTSGITNSTTTVPVASTSGFPSAPFILALNHDVPGAEELILVTAVVGLNLTATRGYDSTTAKSHSGGAIVRHVIAGIDLQDSRTHEEASTNIHGLSGGAAVVGTTSSQTLTNKTISGASLSGTFSGNPTFSGDVTVNGTFSATGIGGVAVARKTADETVTSSTTLQDDNHITFSVVSTGVYHVSGWLSYTGDEAGGLKIGWSAPASATLDWSVQTDNGLPFVVDGVLTTAGTSGTFKLQWAQITSNGTGTTVKSGSFVTLRRVA